MKHVCLAVLCFSITTKNDSLQFISSSHLCVSALQFLSTRFSIFAPFSWVVLCFSCSCVARVFQQHWKQHFHPVCVLDIWQDWQLSHLSLWNQNIFRKEQIINLKWLHFRRTLFIFQLYFILIVCCGRQTGNEGKEWEKKDEMQESPSAEDAATMTPTWDAF